ncbi:hypothetical protein [Chryseobacterium lineare]
MKKVMLLMLGISLFAISCKKQEVQNDNSISDSASTGTLPSDNTTSGSSMDTTASVRDSLMNQERGTSGQATTPNQTNGSDRSTKTSAGTGTDSAR